MIRYGILVALSIVACGPRQDAPPARVGTQRGIPHDTALINENRVLAERESRDIDAWIQRQGTSMLKTGTGVRIKLVQDSAGVNARAGQTAVIGFTVSLIDGTPCYSSKAGEPEEFTIERDDVESGLHEAMQYLSVGDSAVIVIPSHRAYGLAGDMKKIPMRSTVIYHLRLVALH